LPRVFAVSPRWVPRLNLVASLAFRPRHREQAQKKHDLRMKGVKRATRRARNALRTWCRRRGSNPHEVWASRDFESVPIARQQSPWRANVQRRLMFMSPSSGIEERRFPPREPAFRASRPHLGHSETAPAASRWWTRIAYQNYSAYLFPKSSRSKWARPP